MAPPAIALRRSGEGRSPRLQEGAHVSGVHVVLVAHGSRALEANASIADLARGLGERLGLVVAPAFLEMAEPTIPAAIRAAAAGGAERIIIVPFFLAPGVHVRRDLIKILEEARLELGIPVDLADFFGAHPDVPRLLADITTSAIERSNGAGVPR
jgi:sirohydrochlorin ferrochelatase